MGPEPGILDEGSCAAADGPILGPNGRVLEQSGQGEATIYKACVKEERKNKEKDL